MAEGARYDEEVILWSQDQAHPLRSGFPAPAGDRPINAGRALAIALVRSGRRARRNRLCCDRERKGAPLIPSLTPE